MGNRKAGIRFSRSLPVIGLLAAVSLSGLASSEASVGHVNFTVKKSPLVVEVILPGQAVSGRATEIKAVVRNTSQETFTNGRINLSVWRRRYRRFVPGRRFDVLGPAGRRVFKWSVNFYSPEVYKVTAVARATESSRMTHINGRASWLRVWRSSSFFNWRRLLW